MQKLESIGLPLESVKGRGYRLSQALELLGQEPITAHLSVVARQRLQSLQIYQSLDSTNKLAGEQVSQKQLTQESASGTVILSEYQTAGRGRRGKQWVSPFASNIYLSIIWDFDRGAAALQGLSLSIGVAVRRALIELGIKSVQLKWPNDIYVENKKLGGILLEMVGDPAGYCSVVVGIGINVAMPAASGRGIDQAWTDLNSVSSSSISRNQLAALIIDHSFEILADYQDRGFAPYRDEWQESDAFRGRTCTVATAKQSVSGILCGVDDNGALQMQLENGETQGFIGGELSLRLSK